MVINADELDIDWVLFAILGIGVGILMSAVAIALVASRVGSRSIGMRSVLLGLVISIAVPVDIVVVRRAISGEVTGWDLLWGIGLGGVAAWCAARLFSGERRSTDHA